MPRLELKNAVLVQKYFRKFLPVIEQCANKQVFGRFSHILDDARVLENRLQSLEALGLTQSIIDEIGGIPRNLIDSNGVVVHSAFEKFDQRIMNAWAEIRTLSQLVDEGFTDVRKVKEVADFEAKRDGMTYAIQVVRTQKQLSDAIYERAKRIERDCIAYGMTEEESHNQYLKYVDSSPIGRLSDIIRRFKRPLYKFFEAPIDRKNSALKKPYKPNSHKMIVLVTSDPLLQGKLVERLACRTIRKIICNLPAIHFDTLLWLPDIGHGVEFRVTSGKSVECLADIDETNKNASVNRMPQNLNELW